MTTQIIKKAIDELGQSFQEFKNTNDHRLSLIEKNKSDVLIDEKLERINTFLDHTEEKMQKLHIIANRPLMGDGANESAQDIEHKKAFVEYIKSGDDRALRLFERKAYRPRSGADGGFVLPSNMSKNMYISLQKSSNFREVANVVSTQTQGTYNLVVDNDERDVASWSPSEYNQNDNVIDPVSISAKIQKIEIPGHLITQRQLISTQLLENPDFEVEQWLIEKFARHASIMMNDAFINGDGNGKPQGFLTPNLNAQENNTDLQKIITGRDGMFAAANPENHFFDLISLLNPMFLDDNATWVMSRQVLNATRKIKTPEGYYLWQPPAIERKEASILGYKVLTMDAMPNFANGAKIIAIGNFKEAYTIVDYSEVVVIRDPYSSKPFIEFYMQSRVGGKLINPKAIKVLAAAAA